MQASLQNNKNISGAQMEQVKSVVKDHLEKNKIFDTIKSALAKDPNLAKLDKNQIIEKLKSEGILGDIINTIPNEKKTMAASVNKVTES